ncbi:methyltransferase [Nesterenkonia salmonea]|uniref:Methyltransferase n=1 Tax=Nesterenkonia salmonea TaxID=1804987 RepID=A0A5R9BLB4_9MICC|nr:methyltransferase [Nesterenkonia salmonea]TLQ01417.1 methyltransferase [Nesterenkonia salmonea]
MPHPHSAPATPSPAPPASQELPLIAALRADFTEAGFTNDGLVELLGADVVAALHREQVVPGQLRIADLLGAEDSRVQGTRQQSAQWKRAVLTALWLVASPVTADQVEAALPRTGVHGLERLKLIQVTPTGAVMPRSELQPYQVETSAGMQDMWVSSDLSSHQLQGALPHDHVLGIGQASLTLAGVTHRRQVTTALDIGTGCGIQLLHLLDHAEHVVGTDLSERALEFARFNLRLNAPVLDLDPARLEDRVELLHGSLLEPVAGRRFELVVSNPPFVITPRQPEETESDRYMYRDGGREGDALIQELIAGLPAVLSPQGTAQLLGNWESTHDDDAWSTRPRAWVEQSGLSGWFIQRDSQSPPEYAETWLRDASEERGVTEYRRRYAQYAADFAARGVRRIGFGFIWLQGADSHRRWQRFEELTGEIQQPLGPVIAQTAHRAQEELATVLEAALTVPDTVTEERYQRFGAEHPEVIMARQGAGLRRARPISSAAAGFMGASDGEYTAGQLITAVCSLTDGDEDSLAAEIYDLYVEGFLDR